MQERIGWHKQKVERVSNEIWSENLKKKKINLKYLTGLNQDCYNTKNNGPLGLADKAECYRKESMGWEEYRPRTECKHCHSAAM